MSENISKPIDEVINDLLVDETKMNAKDFIDFLRKNDISFDSNSDGHGWAIGGTVGNSIGYLIVNGLVDDNDMPGPWTFWFNSCDFTDSDNISSEIKETAWSHVSPCGKCHDGWKDCGCDDRILFGKKYERLCHSPLMFNNPDKKTLDNMKQLLLIMKKDT